MTSCWVARVMATYRSTAPVMPVPNDIRVDEDDEVELEALRQLRCQRLDAGRGPERRVTDDTGDPLAVLLQPGVQQPVQSRSGPVHHGDAVAADRDRHIGVREHSADDRLRRHHHFVWRPVVDAQGRQGDPVESDPVEAFLPRLGEPVPGLGPVSDDGEAPGRAASQHHLPLRVRELLRFVDDHVGEGPSEQVARRRRASGPRSTKAACRSSPRSIDMTFISESSVAMRSSTTAAISSCSGGEDRLTMTPAPRCLRVAEPHPSGVEER